MQKKNGKQECKILYKIFKPLKFSSKWRKLAAFKDFGLNQMFDVLLYWYSFPNNEMYICKTLI